MTRKEWEDRWWEIYRVLRQANPSADIQQIHRDARKITTSRYGTEPPPERTGPPWWAKYTALAVKAVLSRESNMNKILQVVLRYGPLVAGAALGLAAILEQFIPGYTGIVTRVLTYLSVVGVQADVNLSEAIATFSAGAVVLIGVARKILAIIKEKAAPAPKKTVAKK